MDWRKEDAAWVKIYFWGTDGQMWIIPNLVSIPIACGHVYHSHNPRLQIPESRLYVFSTVAYFAAVPVSSVVRRGLECLHFFRA